MGANGANARNAIGKRNPIEIFAVDTFALSIRAATTDADGRTSLARRKKTMNDNPPVAVDEWWRLLRHHQWQTHIATFDVWRSNQISRARLPGNAVFVSAENAAFAPAAKRLDKKWQADLAEMVNLGYLIEVGKKHKINKQYSATDLTPPALYPVGEPALVEAALLDIIARRPLNYHPNAWEADAGTAITEACALGWVGILHQDSFRAMMLTPPFSVDAVIAWQDRQTERLGERSASYFDTRYARLYPPKVRLALQRQEDG